jgi:hypothetical protein
VVSLYRLVLPFVGLLGLSLLVVTYAPSLSNVRVLDDIAAARALAEKEGRTPRQAWRLECVQFDNSNPLPCSEADRKRYPNGRMPEAAEVARPRDAGAPPSEEDAKDALIAGKGDAASAAPGPLAAPSDDELDDLIMGKGKDAAVPARPVVTGKETDDELDNLIMGKGKDGG